MIQANELHHNGYYLLNGKLCRYDITSHVQYRLEAFEPIPLTPEILEKCGFNQLPHFTVNNGYRIDIGRHRVLTVSCVGTPNEMIFLTEEQPPIVKDIICLRNYDYDGKTYLHDLQNLYYALTKQELNYTP